MNELEENQANNNKLADGSSWTHNNENTVETKSKFSEIVKESKVQAAKQTGYLIKHCIKSIDYHLDLLNLYNLSRQGQIYLLFLLSNFHECKSTNQLPKLWN